MPEILIESQAKEFIAKLPEIHGIPLPPAVHLMMIAIRSRFAREMMGFKVHDLVVERRIVKPHPRRLEGDTNGEEVDPKGSGMSSNPGGWRNVYFEKLYNLATLQHTGHYFINGVQVPHQAMALYGTVGPRNVTAAVCDLLKSMVDTLPQCASNPGAQIKMTKIDSDYFGLLHKHRHPKAPKFHTVDVDDASIFPEVCDMLSPYKDAIWMKTRTSRGYHIIMDMSHKEFASDFYRGGSGVGEVWEGADAAPRPKASRGKEHHPSGVWPQMLERFGKDKEGKARIEIGHDSQEPVVGTRYHRAGEDPHNPNYVTIVE